LLKVKETPQKKTVPLQGKPYYPEFRRGKIGRGEALSGGVRAGGELWEFLFGRGGDLISDREERAPIRALKKEGGKW